ncbi:metallophosphoesterase [Histomonas meleagridis]|uniref:metallophosphoesterase n=1 Tax=Histomonas meleagridis TaxID=135588 RepID=UPI003559CDC0|nr:metallophosphoesterase [Histomonas meleagridis]KAH0797417.1 metallophosphoesterase [Histomonas meleagridis]
MAIFIVLLIYAMIEPFLLTYSYNEIRIPNATFSPFTAVHIGDVHLQWPYPYVTEKSMMKVVENINKLNPDIVFITGDLISRFRTYNISLKGTNSISRILSQIKSRNGIYAVLGNTDLHAKDLVIQALLRSGVHLLRQETITIGDLIISGIDPSKNISMADTNLHKLPPIDTTNKGLRILLSHQPDVALVSFDKGFHLQLSGHTHGGQCTVPFGLGPVLLPSMGKMFPVGLYKVKDMLLYVTKGIGISPLPKPLVRFNTRPEVSILHIVPE